jgi:hypothetical protein
MKNILIIYPHWPPSNLAGVHRARLIANYLPDFGWQPIVLTVKPEFYEEPLDLDIEKTVSNKVIVHKVNAFPIFKIRIIGDIGLRAFFQLRKGALKIIKETKIDFIWIPIPSFYTALLGRILYEKTNIHYGIDYIDPWIRDIKNRINFRSIVSLIIARIFEPYSLKKASLISGVSEDYYKPAIERNFINRKIEHLAIPYGFDPKDHDIKIENLKSPWTQINNCKPMIYAGAFLPNSGYFVQSLFTTIKKLKEENRWDTNVHLFFLGTGNYDHKSILEYASENALLEIVHEIRNRFPYLHILNLLNKAAGILVIGSTEPHYTASKIFQSLSSKRPIFAIFHSRSTTTNILRYCNSHHYLLEYNEWIDDLSFKNKLESILVSFLHQEYGWNVDIDKLMEYSSYNIAKTLAEKLKGICPNI